MPLRTRSPPGRKVRRQMQLNFYGFGPTLIPQLFDCERESVLVGRKLEAASTDVRQVSELVALPCTTLATEAPSFPPSSFPAFLHQG